MKMCLARSTSLWIWILVLAGLSGCASRVGDKDLSGRRAEVVLAGLSQIGTPYVYGGSSPASGFDCSGLTQYAHHVAGLSIPRVAVEQHRASKPVRLGRPGPGDMVFFRTGPGVYHVGLMVDRERFVHASTSRHQVQLARLDTPYWTARYLGAGTYLN
ncbi:glycoside hydrolase [Thiocystis minor]|uniref:C40 family peptidase n=1 Tax=Thiocystis minor TaxID=61597 RepID=UPI0019131F38|nr:C40 family peptidase [Thiocystis minor]MBK5964430.1 glycoside hydrolase [Thiocystis minor]